MFAAVKNRCIVVGFILPLSSIPGGGGCTNVLTRPGGNEFGSLKNWVFLKDHNRGAGSQWAGSRAGCGATLACIVQR